MIPRFFLYQKIHFLLSRTWILDVKKKYYTEYLVQQYIIISLVRGKDWTTSLKAMKMNMISYASL